MTILRLVRPWQGRLTESRLEPWLRTIPSILYMLLIFSVSAIPGRSIPAVADDRIEHFLEYAGFGLALSFTAAGFAPQARRTAGLAACGIFGAAFAASDEWHQSFVPGRDSSLKDVAFDMIGLAASLFMIYFLVKRARRT